MPDRAAPPTDTLVRIAIYDMDKTITRRATYNYFLWHMMRARSPWRMLLMPFLLPPLAAYGVRLINRGRLKALSQRIMIGRRVGREELRHHIETHADVVLGRNIYPQAVERIAADKAAGYMLVLATASYRLYAEPIARRLGFDHVIATDLHIDAKGRVMARLEGDNVYDYGKLRRVKQWMQVMGLHRRQCHMRGYSDHVSDAPLLNYADEGFAVNPHPPLAKLAEAQGWPIIDWR